MARPRKVQGRPYKATGSRRSGITVRETHIQRLDGGGVDYLKLWVSGNQVSAGRSVGKPIFTLTLTPEGHLEGKGPGGYEYAWVIAGK